MRGLVLYWVVVRCGDSARMIDLSGRFVQLSPVKERCRQSQRESVKVPSPVPKNIPQIMKSLFLTLVSTSFVLATQAHSATIAFNLLGKGGPGLLSTNENGAVAGTPGSGNENGTGISYDDVSNTLTLNVAWGTANGFTNLTGNASGGHIHGPTPSSGAASFTENVGVLFFLDSGVTWNPNASTGGITNRTLALSEVQEAELIAGRYYMNIHTTTNGGGEIRGNLVVVPEPSHAVLGLFGLAFLGARRKR